MNSLCDNLNEENEEEVVMLYGAQHKLRKGCVCFSEDIVMEVITKPTRSLQQSKPVSLLIAGVVHHYWRCFAPLLRRHQKGPARAFGLWVDDLGKI